MTFNNPDWHQLADAFGWRCWKVNRSRDVLPVLQDAIKHRGPSLVVVPIDYRENRRMSERLGAFASRIG
jgi:acetolactate synthase-1/2/3 large subunit